ncbi:MAG: penicillin-binding transpeptidase domain-containing protein [Thermodesulfobacteriota bacterium]|nr:penicillin-binding transpeptidase domain-containing protein [Thermodesulfobacteriota bacterium]
MTTSFVGCFWQNNNINGEDDIDSSRLSQQQSHDYYSRQSPLSRGIILDRTGAIFAVSQKTISALARPSKLPQVDDWVPLVSGILGLDPHAVTQLPAKEHDAICLKDSISVEQGLKLKDIRLKGIEIQEKYKRVYPCGTLASPVLGFVDQGGRGLEGIEYTYNSLLNHTNVSQIHAGGQELTLTLEKNIQASAEKELGRQMKKLKADKGCLVIMSVENGEILALASKPSWDPERFWELPATNITNYSLQDNVDLMVLTPLLNWMFEQSELPKSDGRSLDKMAHKWKWETLGKGLVMWSPWAEQELKDFASYNNLSKDLWGLGFGQSTGIDLPGEGRGSLSSALPSSQNCFLRRGVTASPIQIIRAFSALINGNILVTPHVALQSPNEFLTSASSVKDQRQAKIPWFTEELMLKLRENLAVRGGPSLASIRWNEQSKQISPQFPAQVTALGFWPNKSPKVSYIVLLDGVKIDPRERRGTLGRTLIVAKQAAQIPLKDKWRTVKNQETKKELSRMPNLRGKSVRQALDILQSIGISTKLKGVGTVIAQKPRSGTPLKAVKVCSITCK